MARKKRNDNEYVTAFYGIHVDTHEVASAWLTRGGTLHYTSPKGIPSSHYIMPGRSAESELLIVYGLSDLIQFPVGSMESEMVKKMIAELKAKAAERRAPSPQA